MKHFNVLLPALCLLFSACECDDPPFSPPASHSRTVLVYMGVDNNFRDEAAEKIETLRTNWDRTFDGNLFVYTDAGAASTLLHIYHHPQKGNLADTIEVTPSDNSASPQTLTRALNRVIACRPAGSYGLVVLSHATGWLPAGMSDPEPALRSVILDRGADAGKNYMEIADFAGAIPCKLDFILFDACFMGSVEVVCELKDRADYLIASPAEVTAPGFVYSSMSRHLFGGSDLQSALTAVAQDFYEYHNSQSGLFRSATVSVIKTSEVESLKTLCRATIPAEGESTTNESRLENLQTFGYGQQKIYFDLGDYLQSAGVENLLPLQQCVIYKAHTPNWYSAGTKNLQPVRTFSGLSIYIPQEAYPEANEAYKKLKWNSNEN